MTLGGALVLTAVSVLSSWRLHSLRAALIGVGFAALAAQGVFLTSEIWNARAATGPMLPLSFLSAAVLVSFYLAMRKR